MFIVITGLDGSGTSTVAEKLSKMDKGSILLKTPSKEYSQRSLIDDNVRLVSQEAHYLYYLSSVVYMSDYIKKNFDYKNKNIYCVRYLIDTVVSHRVAGLDVELDYEKYNILKPDCTIFVELEESIRQKRITKRGKTDTDKVLDDEIKRSEFLKNFSKLLKPEDTIYYNNLEELDVGIPKLYKRITENNKLLLNVEENSYETN